MPREEMVYGIHAVSALINTKSTRIKQLYVQNGLSSKPINSIVEKAQSQNVTLQTINKKQLTNLTEQANHQGVLAICQGLTLYKESDIPILLQGNTEKPPLVLVLDGIEDPHNLGACLRTADAVGANFVVTTKRNNAPLSATVHKVSCGASQSVPIVQAANLNRAMQILGKEGIWMVGTQADAEQSIFDIDLTGPTAIVMGNEGKGLRQQTVKSCDFLVSIPMQGVVESLNISVANAVCLFETVRQRKLKLPS